jgi:hypothetical protein
MPTFLLDADTMIKADGLYYPRRRFPVFWDWLLAQGVGGAVKIPIEQYEEITAGNGELVDWLKAKDVREALEFSEEVDPDLVKKVIEKGYAADLDESEILEIGRDPFLIAHALAAPKDRIVVSFEVSKPSKKRQNRKVPDVCKDFGVRCATIFELVHELDFTTDWKP